MIRRFLLLSLLFFTVGVNAEKLPLRQYLPALTSVIITDKNYYADYSGFFFSFEREKDCKDFVLSTTEIRAFFSKARLVFEQDAEYNAQKEMSRCQVLGRATLRDGRSVYFDITRTGYANVRFVDAHGISTNSEDYFCDTCGGKFYPAMNKRISDFRPVLKDLMIEKNPIYIGVDDSQTEVNSNMCGDFSLNEADVREFFHKMKRIDSMTYMNAFNHTPCRVQGRMVLQDGREGYWEIDTESRGIMNISDEGEVFIYCADCNPKKFGEPCDLECRASP